METLKDFEALTGVFFAQPQNVSLSEKEKQVASDLRSELEKLKIWRHEEIFHVMKEILVQYKVRMPVLYKLLTGNESGLPLPETLEILVKDKTPILLFTFFI